MTDVKDIKGRQWSYNQARKACQKGCEKMDSTILDPVWDILPLVISIMVLAVVFGAIGGLFSKLKF